MSPLDYKAYTVFMYRMAAAEAAGASEEELSAIHARDVVLTLRERLYHIIAKTHLGAFLELLGNEVENYLWKAKLTRYLLELRGLEAPTYEYWH